MPWEEAIRELRSLRFLFAPSDALACVYRVAKAIFDGSSEPIGGDDFMDILCYVVFNSKLQSLNSLVNYTEAFHSQGSSLCAAIVLLKTEQDVDAEKQYYFTCIQLALSFIRDLSWKAMHVAAQSVRKSVSVKKKMNTLLVVEKEEFLKRFCGSDALFEVVVRDLTLVGYCAYAIREWMLEDSDASFRKAVVVKTNRADDKISVLAVRLMSAAVDRVDPHALLSASGGSDSFQVFLSFFVCSPS